ncbi:hypothetical protein AMTRI_Chr03g138960 [Amborella trichopoda]|uniref:TBCC domain-containing protein 1 n=1 Tax=Amborella trichopoda TaxID=13333 RepID=W1PV16_AMBTC|nr:TBCC domain-containing protein 1 [Amborella trichopoda]ERN11654.1 hypothetical protein AMTR_s00022p00213770 [Amborella trichopoda]|eukprot:XP_006850073.1 TBCC domain-containing protein 1 [Amborella trichopoda]
MDECVEPSTSSPPTAPPTFSLHIRREPFEYGLLPISKLIFTDGTSTLAPLRDKFFQLSFNKDSFSLSSSSLRIDASGISQALEISIENAHLVLDTLATVLPDYGDVGLSDPLVYAKPDEIDKIGANVCDLILFLYIQSYKKLLPRPHKDSASIADVWPSTSVFDGYLCALSPLQFVRTNRRFMPSQADEEAHQLSYLQKHLPNMLALLAQPAEAEDDEAMVLSVDRFEHLGFLFHYGEIGSATMPLSQAVPFFANSDPDMPAVPVLASLIHDWLLQSLSPASEFSPEKVSAKENGPPSASDPDVTMADACTGISKSGTTPCGNAAYSRDQTFVEGISKASVIKQAADIRGCSVKVWNCHESVIYILAPLRYAVVYGCSDATIILGAIGKALRVEHCERVHVITAAKRIYIANCRECTFFLGVNQRPLILGDNHKLQVAPYNTYYTQLGQHMTQIGVDPNINRWDEPLALGMIDPHDSLSHPAGVSDVQAESASCLEPDNFMTFVIPRSLGDNMPETEKRLEHNPFRLPVAYEASQKKKSMVLNEIKQALIEAQLEENRKRELNSALHVYFKEWLYASGNIRQLYCLQGD